MMNHMGSRASPVAILTILWTSLAGTALGGDAVRIDDRRELLVDDHLIDLLEGGARLELHHPRPREKVLTLDRPWEGLYSGYFTVLRDGPKLRMYYRGLPVARHSLDTEVTCVAESEDGVRWTRPRLGLHEVGGTRENNVVLARHRACHNLAPFIDTNPDARPDERYKAVGGTGAPGLVALVSADGLRWRDVREEPVITKGAFDSQNVAFWSATEKRYVCYFRVFRRGVRWIARSVSDDFVHWTEPVDMQFGDGPAQHLYTNQTLVYPRAPHIYLGFPTRFMPGRRALSRKLVATLGTSTKTWDFRNDCADIMLTSSRGGDVLGRHFLEAFVRPGTDPRNWTSRANYAAHGLIQTAADELSLWINQNVGYPTTHIRRYTIRIDGFVSAYAGWSGGELLTKPLVFAGKQLTINYATSAAGGLRVEVHGGDGKPLTGYGLHDCVEIIGDEIERTVVWKNGSDVSALAGKPVRLRFALRDANLYSLRFAR